MSESKEEEIGKLYDKILELLEELYRKENNSARSI